MRHHWLGFTIRAHHKPGRSKQEANTENTSIADQAAQGKAYGTANATDANFTGSTQDTPYYKSLVATGTDATSNAYQNAQANSIAQAKEAGFGQETPIGQAASREATGAEAGALAEIPAKAAAATAPLQLEASGQQLQEGTALGNEGVQYSEQATGLEEQYQKMNQDFWNKMLQMGEGAAAGAAGGGGFAGALEGLG